MRRNRRVRCRPAPQFFRKLRCAAVGGKDDGCGLTARGQDRCAVQVPEQRASPERPVQRPLPAPGVSVPVPAAVLSPAVTFTLTAPPAATRPDALFSPGNVT